MGGRRASSVPPPVQFPNAGQSGAFLVDLNWTAPISAVDTIDIEGRIDAGAWVFKSTVAGSTLFTGYNHGASVGQTIATRIRTVRGGINGDWVYTNTFVLV